MKAAVYDRNGPPDVMQYRDVADPVAGRGEILIRVEAISIEGGDLMHRQRVPPSDAPAVRGYVAAGRVAALGEGVEDFAIGDAVTSFASEGSHAELRAVPASQCWHVPDGMTIPTAAAALITFGTAALAFHLGGLKADDVVLVQGAAGGVGLAAVQIAHRAGARVLGTGTSEAGLAALTGFGLDAAIVVAAAPVDEQVKALTDGRGVDLVIDTIGGRAVTDGIKSLAEGGRLVLIGLFDRETQPIDPTGLLLRRQSVFGCFLGPIIAEPWVRSLIDGMLADIASGELCAPIGRTFPLSEAASAHAYAEQRGRIGRVVMTP